MRARTFVVACAAIAACVAWAGAAGAQEHLIAGRKTGGDVTVRDIANANGEVSGVLVNNSGRQLHDIRLMVHHNWFWKSETKPGDDNPGRVEYYTVKTTIEPHGTASFRYRPSPPLPTDRTDGRFETTIDVVGYTEVGQ